MLTEEKDHSRCDVRLGPPGCSERGADIRDLTPVKRDDRHSEPGHCAEELIGDDIVWSDPADPVEVRQRLERIPRKPVPAERAEECVSEEPLAGDTAARAHACILLRVQSVEERARHKVGGPDHRLGLYKEPTGDAANRESDLTPRSELILTAASTEADEEDVPVEWT